MPVLKVTSPALTVPSPVCITRRLGMSASRLGVFVCLTSVPVHRIYNPIFVIAASVADTGAVNYNSIRHFLVMFKINFALKANH